MSNLYVINSHQRDTILAALRYYQAAGLGEAFNRSPEINVIATNDGEHSGLDTADIDILCESLNEGGVIPQAVVEIEDGVAETITTTHPIRIIVLDADVEGNDTGRIREVGGREVVVHDHHPNDWSDPIGIVNPNYVNNVVGEIKDWLGA